MSELSGNISEHMRQLEAAGMELPVIVKPTAACGVAAAHSMAIVLRAAGFADVRVPLPAALQEYVDHGAVVHKVYVLGPQVRSLLATIDAPRSDVWGCACYIMDSCAFDGRLLLL